MDYESVRVLEQYVSALEEASEQLEQMYLQKNIEGMKKVKAFITEVQRKINFLLLK